MRVKNGLLIKTKGVAKVCNHEKSFHPMIHPLDMCIYTYTHLTDIETSQTRQMKHLTTKCSNHYETEMFIFFTLYEI